MRLRQPILSAAVMSLAKDRILIRNCGNFEGLSDQYVRISLKGPEINAEVAERLKEIFN